MKNTKKLETKFDQLYREAIDDANLFKQEDGNKDIVDTYDDETDDIDNTEGEVTLTLSQDQADALKEVLSQLVGEDDEEEGEEDITDVSDIEELEKEAVEFENGKDAEATRNETKDGKAVDNTGDLEKVASNEEKPEKHYKFVKRVKPTEYKTKTTK